MVVSEVVVVLVEGRDKVVDSVPVVVLEVELVVEWVVGEGLEEVVVVVQVPGQAAVVDSELEEV